VELGEDRQARPTWRDGSATAGDDVGTPCGDPLEFAGVLPVRPRVYRKIIEGGCCAGSGGWPTYPAPPIFVPYLPIVTPGVGKLKQSVGGVIAGGTSSANYPRASTGGLLAGGESEALVVTETTSTGGLLAGGESEALVVTETTTTGGLLAGGESEVLVVTEETTTGGLLAGGESEWEIVSPFACGSFTPSGTQGCRVSDSLPSPTSDLTVAILAYLPSGSGGWQGFVMGRNRTTSGFDDTPQWGLFKIADGRYQAVGWGASYGSLWLAEQTAVTVTGDAWHRWVLRFILGGTSSLWMDGTSTATVNLSGANWLAADAGPTIGGLRKIGGSGGGGYPGQLSDFRYWNRALSDSEIASLDGPGGCPKATLIGDDCRLYLNQTSGTTVTDESGNGYDGSIISGAWSTNCICP
jgi:hypothetical protein